MASQNNVPSPGQTVNQLSTSSPVIPPSLYHDFLTVTYGVLVTEGLIDLSKMSASGSLAAHDLLLFIGAFVFAFHLWMTSVAADHNSSELYQYLAKHGLKLKGMGRSGAAESPGILNGLLLIDATFALTFAAFLLIMFKALEKNPEVIYTTLFRLAIASLAYDVYAAVLYGLSGCPKSTYGKLLARWTVLDIIFILCAYSLRNYGVPIEGVSASLFLALAIATLIMDVVLLNAERYGGL